MKSPLDKIRPEVRGLSQYTLEQYRYEIKINQNENPFDIPVHLKDQVMELARDRSWARYPDFVPRDFQQKLAHYVRWDPEGILVGNGSNELIRSVLMVSIEKGSRVVIPVPTFTLYKLMSTLFGADVIEVKLNTDYTFNTEALREAAEDADLLILSSPNNPTGCVITDENLRLLLQNTDALVLVDEAYCEFSGTSCLPLLKSYKNLIILRTFSKAFSLAGLRVGYLIADPLLTREIAKAKLPYDLNFFSQMAAMKVLENIMIIKERIKYIIAQREILYETLQQIPGVTPYPSHANFILFETILDAKYLFSKLLEHGVLVRDVSSYPMLAKALRVTVGKEEENKRFVRALTDIMSL
ncbi:MAG TPA: histidinol-phosphate transaminase [Candidatus Latescibacteria bacterium]|nr:histidinol-phosphate transaminase [Candidatus Latescibacterota bacterium]